MDTVADAMAAAHTDTASKGIPFAAGGHGIDSLHEEIALTLLPSLLLFGGSAVGIGLTVYFFINLSDCQEDLINPYTLCERVNGKLHWELAAHAAAVAALLLEELVDGDRLHWIALILATPGLALRIVWYRGKKLEIDATNVFNPRFTGRLKTRWGLMCFWHAMALLFGFVQCANKRGALTNRPPTPQPHTAAPPAHDLTSARPTPCSRRLVLHMVLGLHNSMPNTMKNIGEHHVKRAVAMGGLGGMHPMNNMMFGH